MKLSIITVTYNSQDTIDIYLNALTQNLPLDSEIIIVDNNSTDGTVELLKSYQSKKINNKLEIIYSNKNNGFSIGCNQGAKIAKGKYLLFLNPDTEVLKDSLNKLVELAEKTGDFGIIAPQLLKPDGKIQASVRNLPTLTRAIQEYMLGKKSIYDEYVPQSAELVNVEAVYGAAMLIKKETFVSIGGFSEDYFLYYEDIDLCRRMNQRGLKIIYYPEAKIKHIIGSSAKTIKQEQLPFGLRTLAYFIPIKQSGSIYYQIKSGNIYFGSFKAFLIRLISLICQKLGLSV